ncbi:hypothetical protein GOODEAATRI_031823 [Goodea atripinnis]|uniref:Uncharacterized protein n=1 Tax=Goodea atripinnis TaxID=208336 RepID=A0ABV0MWT8_9TELE
MNMSSASQEVIRGSLSLEPQGVLGWKTGCKPNRSDISDTEVGLVKANPSKFTADHFQPLAAIEGSGPHGMVLQGMLPLNLDTTIKCRCKRDNVEQLREKESSKAEGGRLVNMKQE